MRLLLISTGGTISTSARKGGVLHTDIKKAEAALIRRFQEEVSRFWDMEITSLSPIDTLSENMDIPLWNRLLKCLKNIAAERYDGILILHGTDTLAYTANLLSLLFAGTSIPILLISSNYPLEDRRANGYANFKGAVEAVGRGLPPNIYVCYRNRDGKTYLHLGSRLTQCPPGSDEFFSAGLPCFGEVSSSRLRLYQRSPATPEKYRLLAHKIPSLEGRILLLHPYVGLRYDSISLSPQPHAVIHGLYHSSTACVSSPQEESSPYSLLTLAAQCQKKGIPFFLAPFSPDRLEKAGGQRYDSTQRMLDAGLLPLCGMTLDMCYVKALAGISAGHSGSALYQFLQEEINGEFIKI